MTVQVLGSGCAKCQLLAKEAQAALDELGWKVEVEKITDFGEIAALGVLMTPALAIDRVVRSSGRVLTRDRVKALLQEAQG